MKKHSPFKILSIDGGGIKGTFVASLLVHFEKHYCKPGENIASYFDLIVGTSTGGILALGLGLGFPAGRILDFYQTYGQQIFPQPKTFIHRWKAWLANWINDRYDRRPLEQALFDVFANRQLGDAKTRLIIPAFNIETGQVHIYKTAHHSRLKCDYQESVCKIALATSAAPTYFPVYQNRHIPFVDGGIWANNPALVAITEAQTLLEQDLADVSLLSIGCTEEPFNIAKSTKGRFRWAQALVDLFSQGQHSCTHGSAQLLLQDRYKRISPTMPNKRFSLDGVKQINELEGLGEIIARQELDSVKPFFQNKVNPFIPNYTLQGEP